MTAKKKLFNLFPAVSGLLLLSFIVLPLFISCKSADPEYTRCEEMCEYSRRDCVHLCGGYDSLNFSFDFSGSGIGTPYACTDKCDKKSESCLKRCGDRSIPHE